MVIDRKMIEVTTYGYVLLLLLVNSKKMMRSLKICIWLCALPYSTADGDWQKMIEVPTYGYMLLLLLVNSK